MLVHLVRPVGIGHGGLQLLQLGGHRAHRAGAVHHLGDGAAAGHLAHVLAEVADGDAAIDGDLALVGQLLPGDHAEERRLAGAVGPDEPDLLAAFRSAAEASMKRIWWPFCLLMLSRRIMCARDLQKLRRPYAMRRANGRAFRTASRLSFERERSGRASRPGRSNEKGELGCGGLQLS